MHGQIRAPVLYLPEYLKEAPRRVLRRLAPGPPAAGLSPPPAAPGSPTWRATRRPNRIRRFGQALVLAAELPPEIGHLHAHFLHTPARWRAMPR